MHIYMIIKTRRANGDIDFALVLVANIDNYQVDFMRKRDDGFYEWTDGNYQTVMKTDVIKKWNLRNPKDTGLFEEIELEVGTNRVWKLVGEI
jgi:hypothetical protein